MMGSHKYRAVIFDMDGTILDTIEDLTDSLNYVMEKFGYPVHTVEEMKTFVGNGMYMMIKRAVPMDIIRASKTFKDGRGRNPVSNDMCTAETEVSEMNAEMFAAEAEAQLQEMYRCFRDYYRNHCNIKTEPYEGITELLKKLRESGIKTAVISNKADEAVKELCGSVFKDCFDYYLGAVDGVKLKPDRDMVDMALDRLGIMSEEAVYVGDSQVDLQTAANAQMDCISVTWGFRSREFLIENGARVLVDSPSEIYEMIRHTLLCKG